MCIESIRKYTAQGEYEVIIVDNNSQDDTVSWLLEQSDIHVILNTTNLGFPKACNQGAMHAKGDSVLFLNNDTIVTNNWLSNLHRALYSDESIGAVGAVTNYAAYYQKISINYGENLIDMQKFAKNFNKNDSQKWEERLKLVGFCMFIKMDVLRKVGLFDEAFSPGHHEDDDLSFRIRQLGYKLLLCKDTFIHHFGSVSFKSEEEIFRTSTSLNAKKFEEKWGFHSTYHTYIREEMLQLISKEPKKILEVGCGCGATLLKCRNEYPAVKLYGVELNENAARVAKQFADVQVCDVESGELELPLQFFDYILCPDVLEHLKNPGLVLRHLAKTLKSKGFLIASIPNVMHFSIVRDLLNGKWTYCDAGILDSTNIRFFTLHEITKLFLESGYRITQVTANFSGARTTDDQEFMQYISSYAKINTKLLKQMQAYQYIILAQKEV